MAIANGVVPTPQERQAVLRDLEVKGLDPSVVQSCMPAMGMRGHQREIAGCNCYDKCPFNRKALGGFKGQGPKNVKYYINPNDGTKRAQELYAPCYAFVRLLNNRMEAGIRDRRDGKNGEIISIVGGELGVVIPGIDPKYMHVCRTMVRVKDNPNSPNPKFIKKLEEREVPAYEHSDMITGTDFERMLESQFLAREAAENDGTYGPPVQYEPDFDLTPDPVKDDELEAVPVAEPVKRK